MGIIVFAFSKGVQNFVFYLHIRKNSKVTDACLCSGHERIYLPSFFSEFAFLLEHRNTTGVRIILYWWMHKVMANTMRREDSILCAVVSVSYDGL